MESGSDHYSFDWNLNLIFDHEMKELRAVSFKVAEITFHPHMDPNKQQQIRKILVDDVRDGLDGLEGFKMEDV